MTEYTYLDNEAGVFSISKSDKKLYISMCDTNEEDPHYDKEEIQYSDIKRIYAAIKNEEDVHFEIGTNLEAWVLFKNDEDESVLVAIQDKEFPAYRADIDEVAHYETIGGKEKKYGKLTEYFHDIIKDYNKELSDSL